MKNKIEDPIYNELFSYLIDKYGERNVNYIDAFYQIEVRLTNVFYTISFSGNETKFSFCSVPTNLIQEIDFKKFIEIKSFRVFNLELAKKYIEFKDHENEFINSIQG